MAAADLGTGQPPFLLSNAQYSTINQMFGFDGSTTAIVHFLGLIALNKEGDKLTHNEVRAYARLMLVLVPGLLVDNKQQINFLLAAISASGLAHYDRSFAAAQIIKLIDDSERKRSDTVENESF